MAGLLNAAGGAWNRLSEIVAPLEEEEDDVAEVSPVSEVNRNLLR